MRDNHKKFWIYSICFLIVAIVSLFFFKEKKIIAVFANFRKDPPGSKFIYNITKEDLLSVLIDYKIRQKTCNYLDIKAEGVLASFLIPEKNFYTKNENKVFPIASLTKIMTAIIAKEQIHKDVIEFSASALNAFGDFGGFKKGEKYHKEDLIKGMIVSSSNDAAYALAEQIGLAKFVLLMNEKAKEIGMYNTKFADPAGLSYLNRSSCSDLFILVKYVLNKYPDFFEVTRKKQIKILELNRNEIKTIKNDNLLTANSNFKGGKTGFLIRLDRGSLISLFNLEGQDIAIIVLNDGFYERYDDTRKIYECASDILKSTQKEF